MKVYQQRVVEEKKELDEKISKLIVFIDHSSSYLTMDDQDKELLGKQLDAMRDYSKILGDRISRF